MTIAIRFLAGGGRVGLVRPSGLRCQRDRRPGGRKRDAVERIDADRRRGRQGQGEQGYTAALLWHTSSDFVNAVTAGAKDEFARLGIEVVAETDAGFDAAKQLQRHRDGARQASRASSWPCRSTRPPRPRRSSRRSRDGVKLVLLSNVPAGYKQGKDYVAHRHRRPLPDGQAGRRRAGQGDRQQGQGRLDLPRRPVLRDQPARQRLQDDDREGLSRHRDRRRARASPTRRAPRRSPAPCSPRIPTSTASTSPGPSRPRACSRRCAPPATPRPRSSTLDLSEPVALDMVKDGNVAALVADKAYELGRTMAAVGRLRPARQAGAGLRRRPGDHRHQGERRRGLAGIAQPRRRRKSCSTRRSDDSEGAPRRLYPRRWRRPVECRPGATGGPP